MKKLILLYLGLIIFVAGCNTSVTSSSNTQSQQGEEFTVTFFTVEPSQTALLPGSTETYVLYKYYYSDKTAEATNLITPTWLVAGNIGTISQDGTFTATREGTGYVIASYEGNVDYVAITVTGEASKTSPVIPTGLTLSNVSPKVVFVAWNPVSYASTYRVRYSTKPILYGASNQSSNNASLLLTDLTPNSTYYIQVQAYNDYGYSRYSSAESFITGK